MTLSIGTVKGLSVAEQLNLDALVKVYNAHENSNNIKARYYEGHIRLGEVNLGIALPRGMRGLEIGCEWGRKCVDVLASRSMFDGFVGVNGENNEALNKIVEGNNLISEYQKATKDELKLGCTFATLSADKEIGCKIRFHSARTSAALWDGSKGRISCGFSIIDTVRDESEALNWHPAMINYYTDEAVIVLVKDDKGWSAKRHKHKMGRPLMVPMIYGATSDKPFGSSRIKEPIRRLIQGYVRTIANATIAAQMTASLLPKFSFKLTIISPFNGIT